VLKAVLGEPNSSLPAAMVRPTNGRLIWLLDRPAAALLSTAKAR
jgi:6-phosphogluconolactonase/glucosamine-6-phosphate isomerase/deaminase